jgi:Phosphate-induced protein 1 conserved region
MAKEASMSSAAIKFLGPAAIAVLMTSIFGLAGAVQATEVRHPEQVRHQEGEQLQPTGKGFSEVDPTGLTAQKAWRFYRGANNGISYHGGPVMLNQVNIYYIWYGAWNFATDNTNTLLSTFGSRIGGTPYFNINTTYTNSSNQAVSGQVALPKSATDTGSQGSALSDNAVQAIVAKALSSTALPTDPNGVYFVLTSKEVTETSGFCTQYCAWHTHGTINGQDIKFGFVGNPLQCPSACSDQTATPNNNLGADGMANLIAHELSESVTDPDLNAWFDQSGNENADKCAWNFGTTSTLSTGAKYNVNFGSTNWLLQQNWENASGGYCSLKK